MKLGRAPSLAHEERSEHHRHDRLDREHRRSDLHGRTCLQRTHLAEDADAGEDSGDR